MAKKAAKPVEETRLPENSHPLSPEADELLASIGVRGVLVKTSPYEWGVLLMKPRQGNGVLVSMGVVGDEMKTLEVTEVDPRMTMLATKPEGYLEVRVKALGSGRQVGSSLYFVVQAPEHVLRKNRFLLHQLVEKHAKKFKVGFVVDDLTSLDAETMFADFPKDAPVLRHKEIGAYNPAEDDE